MIDDHDRIDALVKTWPRRALVHALVALGHPLRCAADECLFDRDVFVSGNGDPRQISVDHINGRVSDRPENLQILHMGCNSAKFARAQSHSAETREKIAAAMRGARNPQHGKTGAASPRFGKKGRNHRSK